MKSTVLVCLYVKPQQRRELKIAIRGIVKGLFVIPSISFFKFKTSVVCGYQQYVPRREMYLKL
jgi:hypothetical protein